MTGIIAAGAYIPQSRLSRAAILEANRWFNPALKALAKGERAICNWDEDALTMAVEAGRDCLQGRDRSRIVRVILASTTAPFADRQNAAVVAEALNLPDEVACMDVGASLRAGTSALLSALAGDAGEGETLLIASEHRQAKAAGAQEMAYGDGAVAFVLGAQGAKAELVATASLTRDFVDHYRAGTSRFDYAWEERWARDEGLLKIIPEALERALAEADVTGADLDCLILPVAAATGQKIARQLGVAADALSETLFSEIGDCGAAHPLIQLADVLAAASPGQLVALVGWGQGSDAIVLQTCDGVAETAGAIGVRGYLARRREETNYNRYLSFNSLIEQERGIRAELDKQTAVSALYRNRDMILGFVGGRCRLCGTVQFPRSNVCVSPNCGKFHTQDPHPMAETRAHVQSWTADNLTYSPDPPHHFGMVVFDGGGRLMADFTDVERGSLEVGCEVRMMFRLKDVDDKRGFRRYFWKAAPVSVPAENQR